MRRDAAAEAIIPFSRKSPGTPRIVQFVAMQLNIHPEVLAEYGSRRPQTRDEHLVQIRTYLKLRPYTHEADDPRTFFNVFFG